VDYGQEVVWVERDARGRAAVLLLSTGERVTAAIGYWAIYVNARAFYTQRPGSTERAYVDVTSPTVGDGPYFRTRIEDAGKDSLDRLR
jgi:hypothetical protein